MNRRDLTVRAAGLVFTGEFAVHELRYALAPGHGTEHGYLPLFGVLSVALLALAAGQLAGRLERARAIGADRRVRISFRAAWLGLAAAIVLIFGVQESVEALVGGSRELPGVAAFGGWGWVAVPLAVVLSAVLALALKGAGAAVSAAARAARAALSRRRPRGVRTPVALLLLPSCGPLGRNLAGRGPPPLLRP